MELTLALMVQPAVPHASHTDNDVHNICTANTTKLELMTLIAAVAEEDPMGFENMPIDPASTRPSRGFQRAILKEWNMLREGLPPTIWVRAFESRCSSPLLADSLGIHLILHEERYAEDR